VLRQLAVANANQAPRYPEFLLYMRHVVSSLSHREDGGFPPGLCLAVELVALAFVP